MRNLGKIDAGDDARAVHRELIAMSGLYRSTSYWHPVLTAGDRASVENAVLWLDARAARGTQRYRNDWLNPLTNLFLIRSEALAIQFKLSCG